MYISTHIKFHVSGVLVQPLLVHYRKGHTVKQIKGPFIFCIYKNIVKNRVTIAYNQIDNVSIFYLTAFVRTQTLQKS